MDRINPLSRTTRWTVVTLFAITMTACGGGGGGGEDPGPGTGGGGGGGTPGDNNSVAEVLDDLGINTSYTARVDNDGDALPEDDYAPMGGGMMVNQYSEVMLFGVPLEDSDVADNSGTQNAMTLTNLVPGSNNRYTWEVINDEPLANTPWTSLGAKRNAVAGDFDGDGLEEIAIVYQDSGDVQLVIQQDADESYALSTPVNVDNGTYDALFVTAGDYDADGQIDLVLGLVSATGNASIKMLENTGGNFAFNGLSVNFSADNFNIAQLVLASGNLDYDNAYELAVVTNAGTLTSTNNNLSGAEHRYYLFDDAENNFAELASSRISFDPGSGRREAVYGNVALGDVDGDSIDEVVLAGMNQIGGINSSAPMSSFRHAVQVLDDAKRSFTLLAETSTPVLLDNTELPPDGERYSEDSGTQQAMNHVALTTADVDGDGAAEILVNQRLYQSQRSTPGTLVLYDDDNDIETGFATIPGIHWFGYNRSDSFNFNWRMNAVAAGDVTLDGRDNIVLYSQRQGTSTSQTQQIQVWGHDQINGWSLIQQIDTDKRSSIGAQDSYYPQVLLPDAELDDGSFAIQFSEGSHQLVFTQPIIIAALAGAPCATDLGQNLSSSCRTAYGQGVNDNTTRTDGTTATGRLFAGFGAGDPVTQNSFEMTASIERTTSSWDISGYSLTKTLTYETGAIEDSVVLTVMPIDVYEYTVLSHVDPTLVGEVVTINLPREPITTLVTLDYYNQIVDEGFLQIGSDVFGHTEGDPSSYPTASDKFGLLNRYDGLESSVVSVGEGQGQTVATIEEFTTTGSGNDYSTVYGLDVRATGGLGGYVVGGFSVGYGTTGSLEVTHGDQTLYQGAVGNISEAAFDAGENYNWGLFAYLYDDHRSGQHFEVLNFWVED